MRRAPSLRELSSEHHSALVLARHIRQSLAESTSGLERLWQTVVDRFHKELEPHFQKEERGVLRTLRSIGQLYLVERTLDEHRAMRSLVTAGGPADLPRLAQMLVDHVRFEERELFAAAQEALSQEELETTVQQDEPVDDEKLNSHKR